jgi:hypothetical protein
MDFFMTVLIICASMALIPAKLASNKGRDFDQWWLYGFLIFPIALIHSITIKMNDKLLLETNQFKQCPFCAELIKPEAIVCKHCHKEIRVKPE